MSKKIIRVSIEGGKASDGPPLGPALKSAGVNINQVVSAINEKTKDMAGMKLPVKVIVDSSTKEFEIDVDPPSTLFRIRKELKGLAKDLLEVVVTLAVIILVSKLLLGAQMLVPLVAVTSNSMLHTSDGWRDWLADGGVPESRIDSFPLQGGFSQGDMILTITPDGRGTILPIFSETEVGDVVIYNRDNLHRGNEPIIHRVVGMVRVEDWKVSGTEGVLDCLTEEGLNGYIETMQGCHRGEKCPYAEIPSGGDFKFYITKGDNNRGSDQCGPGNGIALPVPDSQLTARGWLRIPYVGWLKLGLNAILGF